MRTELVKGLGLYGATSVVAGTMIGTAIFLVSSDMLRDVGTPVMVLVVWVFAGTLSLFGALGYAELGAAIPEAGGEYVYLHRAYGPMMGFLYGWTQFLVAKSTSIATIATGFLLYLAYFFPRLAGVVWQGQANFGSHALAFRLTGIQAGATAMILLLSVINILGVGRYRRFSPPQNWLCSRRSLFSDSPSGTGRLSISSRPPGPVSAAVETKC